ncbi:MAG: efflux RND transporter periplasmic adaptor subunit, partial [Bacteroidetes bacterium]|nr:efflux RND transporter periplasmic adaptor subunit [Bacteroidota bacterium]
MKTYLKTILLLLLMLPLFMGCGPSGEDQAAAEHPPHSTTYTCPMHPQIVENQPGSCPICGMDLVPQTHEGQEIEITEDLAFVLEPTNQTVLASVATTSPDYQSVEASLEMEGIITYDTRKIYSIPARFGGRIEQLYIKYNYQPIRKGQKLMELYSPELVTAQKELLYLLQSAPEDDQLIEGAKQRLLLLGATPAQIRQLISSGEASYTFSIYSPYDGYAISLNTAPPTATPGRAATGAAATSGGGGMAGMGASAASSAPDAGMAATAGAGEEIQLREGMYVTAGQTLLQVVN